MNTTLIQEDETQVDEEEGDEVKIWWKLEFDDGKITLVIGVFGNIYINIYSYMHAHICMIIHTYPYKHVYIYTVASTFVMYTYTHRVYVYIYTHIYAYVSDLKSHVNIRAYIHEYR